MTSPSVAAAAADLVLNAAVAQAVDQFKVQIVEEKAAVVHVASMNPLMAAARRSRRPNPDDTRRRVASILGAAITSADVLTRGAAA